MGKTALKVKKERQSYYNEEESEEEFCVYNEDDGVCKSVHVKKEYDCDTSLRNTNFQVNSMPAIKQEVNIDFTEGKSQNITAEIENEIPMLFVKAESLEQQLSENNNDDHDDLAELDDTKYDLKSVKLERHEQNNLDEMPYNVCDDLSEASDLSDCKEDKKLSNCMDIENQVIKNSDPKGIKKDKMRIKLKKIHKKGDKVRVKAEPKESNKLYKCTYCDRSFKFNFQVRDHVKNVHSLDEFKCFLCDKVTKCKKYLWEHLKAVHMSNQKISQVKCDLCDSTFKHPYHLQFHMKFTHPGGTNTCEVCNMVFKNKKMLKEHMKKSHYMFGQVFECWCGQQFRSTTFLQQHEENYHC